jgi:hypothetical protein
LAIIGHCPSAANVFFTDFNGQYPMAWRRLEYLSLLVVTQIFARDENSVSLAGQRLLTLAMRFNALSLPKFSREMRTEFPLPRSGF